MKLKLALPVIGALALFAALPETAEARRRSSFDISVGLGHSHYGGHRGYGRRHDSSVSFRYSRGRDYGYHGSRYRNYNHAPRYHNHAPRYYHSSRPIYRSERYHYRPAPRYVYRDYDYGYYRRPVVRRYYYRDYDECY